MLGTKAQTTKQRSKLAKSMRRSADLRSRVNNERAALLGEAASVGGLQGSVRSDMPGYGQCVVIIPTDRTFWSSPASGKKLRCTCATNSCIEEIVELALANGRAEKLRVALNQARGEAAPFFKDVIRSRAPQGRDDGGTLNSSTQ